MQNVPWPTAAHFTLNTLDQMAHSRGGASAGGDYSFERGPGARWQGALEVPPMANTDAFAFRAFLHSLRGRAGTFLLPIPRPLVAPVETDLGAGVGFDDSLGFDDDLGFSDDWDAVRRPVFYSVTDSAVAADAETFVSAGLVASALCVVGAFVTLGNIATTGQLLRITAISGNNVTVRPRIRSAYSASTELAVGRVTGKFRLDKPTPPVPLNGFYSSSVNLSFVEHY